MENVEIEQSHNQISIWGIKEISYQEAYIVLNAEECNLIIENVLTNKFLNQNR